VSESRGFSLFRDDCSLDHLASMFATAEAPFLHIGDLLNTTDSGTDWPRPAQARNSGDRSNGDWTTAELADQFWSEIGAQLVQGLASPWN
jgi:hypothetical protein